MPEVDFKTVPFEEAITFLRQKVNIPTEAWDDIWQGMHSRAFVVAGAMKHELLSDFHDAINKAISDGETITDFRKRFDDIVARHGWSYKGKRGWRTGVIFHTNMRTAYAAGQFAQMQAGKDERPFLRYIGGLSENPRPLHLEWNGMVLPFDDPWWDTHRPPNGWGCKCQVVSHSQSELERDGRTVSEKGPDDGTFQWTNPKTGEVHNIPKGIDPGWDYDPGKAAWGKQLSEQTMAEWDKEGAAAWERLTPGDATSKGQPGLIPIDKARKKINRKIVPSSFASELKKVLGGEEKIYAFEAGEFRYDVLVNAETLARHVDPKRGRFFPLLSETLEDPFEVWQSFERHRGTGKVRLRQRIIKAVDTGDKKGMLIVTNAVNGMMEAWTVVPTDNLNYLNNQRVGELIWKRE